MRVLLCCGISRNNPEYDNLKHRIKQNHQQLFKHAWIPRRPLCVLFRHKHYLFIICDKQLLPDSGPILILLLRVVVKIQEREEQQEQQQEEEEEEEEEAGVNCDSVRCNPLC